MKHWAPVIALGAAATMLLAGCTSGTSGTEAAVPAGDALEAFGSEDAQSWFDDTYQAALDAGENQVVIYGPPDNEDFDAAFEARFPGISIVVEQLQGADRDVRLEAEEASGNFVGDVAKDGQTPIIGAVQKGQCTDFESIYDVPAEWLTMDGQMVMSSVGVFGIAYNTDMLDENEVPTSWEDLLDPKWKGKITVVNPSTGGVSAFTLAQMLTPEANNEKYGIDYIEALKAQDLNLAAKDPLAVQAVATGETPLAILVYRPFFLSTADKGAPIDFSFPFESDNQWTASAVCKLAGAPDSLATDLYLNWRYSPEGQAASAATGNYPVMPGSPSPDGLPAFEDVSLFETLPDEERVEGYAPYIEQVITLFG